MCGVGLGTERPVPLGPVMVAAGLGKEQRGPSRVGGTEEARCRAGGSTGAVPPAERSSTRAPPQCVHLQ